MALLDCVEILFAKYDSKDVFTALHPLINTMKKDGIVVLCVAKDTLAPRTEKVLRHMCEEVIYL
ncbi:hypothetical protein HY490_01975 [Candidatus Woesearchaeota archaeon]|nr:hypothetical protein [Candidatus Woesearchaeota archaeon]